MPAAPAPNTVSPASSLTNLHGLEVMGSVPIWVLSGLRLHRVGWKHMQSGWVVGVYEMDASLIDLGDETSSADSTETD